MKFEVRDDCIETSFNHGILKISSDETVGYRPVELFVSAVASCSGMVLRNILKKQRVTYERLTIDAAVERDEQEANRITKISLQFHLYGKDLNEAKLNKNLRLVRRHCSMIRSVSDSMEVEESITIHETDGQ